MLFRSLLYAGSLHDIDKLIALDHDAAIKLALVNTQLASLGVVDPNFGAAQTGHRLDTVDFGLVQSCLELKVPDQLDLVHWLLLANLCYLVGRSHLISLRDTCFNKLNSNFERSNAKPCIAFNQLTFLVGQLLLCANIS